MSSWVRYSVAVYVGLMIAGALAGPRPETSEAGNVETWVDPTDFQAGMPTATWHKPGVEVQVEVKVSDRKLPSWVKE